LYRRKAQHKSACHNKKQTKTYNLTVYKFIRENGGFNNWDLIELHKFSCENKREKELEERKWIEMTKPALNKSLPFHEDRREYYKRYYLDVKIQKREYMKKNNENFKKEREETKQLLDSKKINGKLPRLQKKEIYSKV
jgi:hypothetical protein